MRLADEYVEIAIAAADEDEEDEELAPQEIAGTTAPPPHRVTCSVRARTTVSPPATRNKVAECAYPTVSLPLFSRLSNLTPSLFSKTAVEFYRCPRHRQPLARGSSRLRAALPFLACSPICPRSRDILISRRPCSREPDDVSRDRHSKIIARLVFHVDAHGGRWRFDDASRDSRARSPLRDYSIARCLGTVVAITWHRCAKTVRRGWLIRQ